MKIRFKKLVPEAVVPVQASAGAANFDFVCTSVEKREGFENKYILHFGIAAEVPEGYKMVIAPRSSITGTEAIMQNSPGQVDSDYRGEVQLRITMLPTGIKHVTELGWTILPLDYPPCPFKVGERVAQGWIEKVIPVEFEEAEELSETSRGTGGFGSIS